MWWQMSFSSRNLAVSRNTIGVPPQDKRKNSSGWESSRFSFFLSNPVSSSLPPHSFPPSSILESYAVYKRMFENILGENFLLLSDFGDKNNVNVLSIKNSYIGAIGL